MTTNILPLDLLDSDRLEAIATRLDLRQPNKEAVESIAFEIGQHYKVDRESPPFEAVVDSATGVGKTYILAAAIEYLAADGVRDFAVITPGRTILEKTVANFTPGHPKSLLGGMEVRPVLITSENFATAAMRAAMDDPDQVKLFVFTVQALTKPQTALGRRTHKFQEGLGEAFYGHLQGLSDLVVFADEHHTYYGPAFSEAVRDLRPWVLIGLTATPHKKTPSDQIIYRYPLAAAIADRLVKTPVVVGRKDDRTDPYTKLLDGVRLLEFKQQMLNRWCRETGAENINSVMLVIAPNIAEAEEIHTILTDASFAGGRYMDGVLTIHSNAPDEALASLEKLEDSASPYRVVISVGMLKEGWDVKNVYVIASMRASVSDILTEQTLGRGLRLPFGKYTGLEILDTLEVLGHERYEELLRRAGILNQQFVDRRTRAVLRRNAQGEHFVMSETTMVEAPLVSGAGTSSMSTEDRPSGEGGVIRSLEDETARAQEQVTKLQVELPRRTDFPVIYVPVLRMTAVRNDFSLADITDLAAFRRLGEQIAADPTGQLRRVTLGARIVEGPDGLRRTELVPARAMDRFESPASLVPLEDLRRQLVERVIGAPVVPARANERRPAGEIVGAFVGGLGAQAEKILSSYMDRAAAGLIQWVISEHRKFSAAPPSYGEVVELKAFNQKRFGRLETSPDRFDDFRRGVGYEGYDKSLYAQDWFDSSTERQVANILEDEEPIKLWVRLQINDLPILWTTGREYHPDFIAIDDDGVHWIIEAKMNRLMSSDEVQGKREAARRWANHVNADASVRVTWRYLLLSETDVNRARGSWAALKRLGGY